jgi:hypothetical protein
MRLDIITEQMIIDALHNGQPYQAIKDLVKSAVEKAGGTKKLLSVKIQAMTFLNKLGEC